MSKVKQARTRIENSIHMPVDGPPTLEQWRRMQAEEQASVHVVRRTPPTKTTSD